MPQNTTRGGIAVKNLSGRIQTFERRAELRPDDLSLLGQLLELLGNRAHFTNRFEDLSRMRALTEDLPQRMPGAAAHLLRARARAAVHRFEEALNDVAKARELGATPKQIGTLETSLHIALGRDLDAALVVARARAESAPSLANLSSWAGVEAALGQFDAAEDHYQAALRSYHDVSPFPVAQIMFQRGVMWAELADQPERALPLYAEAVRRLPQYAVANIHLAELEIEKGRQDGARQRLQALIAGTEDPEALGLLAELRLAVDANDAEAHALRARAAARYESLLAEHPAAFWDHAAEFFAGPGADPPRALRLALDNLALRQTPRAQALVIEAALLAGDDARACNHIEAARALGPRSRNLAALVAREGARCNDQRATLSPP